MPDKLPPDPHAADVRMRGFSRRVTVQEALGWLDSQVAPLPPGGASSST